MPELPEVESLCRSLLPRLIGRAVTDAAILRRDILVAPGDPPGGFSRQRGRRSRPAPITPADLLQAATITDIHRRGKQLAILARSDSSAIADRAVIVQLGMTGSIDFLARDDEPDAHTHALWTLGDRTRFRFHDPRRFGSLRICRTIAALDEHWQSLGPDALTINAAELRAALASSRRAVKAVLLDQAVLAGVGNIYADEALSLSAIHPAAIAARITPASIDRLAESIRSILTAAVRAGGSTLRDYADADGRPGSYVASHRVYGRGGLPCLTCGRRLSHALLAQRTTVWCAHCQRSRR